MAAGSSNASISDLGKDAREIGLPRKPPRLVARVHGRTIDDDIELAHLARVELDGPAPATFDPSLHTEGFGFVASGGAVMDDDGHGFDPGTLRS